ncbi:hypothetical protein BD770DRAFT_385669 [Pilaira anomala]|nr:hypothetical protein BD770DRAFT_385669 [Pilaira anomala]
MTTPLSPILPQLPFEILTLVFNYLDQDDLVQCQLTNKGWHRASMEQLYSEPIIKTNKRSLLYIRTISDSSQLASYLKVPIAYKGCMEDPNLIAEVARRCPNITSLNVENITCWGRISEEVSEGRLSRLQYLPYYGKKTFAAYISTALKLKASLKELKFRFEPESNQALRAQVSEFKQLKSLYIIYSSNKQLSDFDKLIDDCSHLESLNIRVRPEAQEDQITTFDTERSIRRRPDILTLECGWEVIDNDSQLQYVMTKLPNLKRLVVELFDVDYDIRHSGYCSPSILCKFLRYIINDIPDFKVALALKKQDLGDVWMETFLSKADMTDMTVRYRESLFGIDDPNRIRLNIEKKKLTIRFLIGRDEIGFPHVDFFLKVGHHLQSVQLTNWHDMSLVVHRGSPSYGRFISYCCILEILLMCPFLKKLKVTGPLHTYISIDVPFGHTNVETLSVFDVREINECGKFLTDMSSNLPNLKNVDLEYFCEPKNFESIVITMPSTSIDQLRWNNVKQWHTEYRSSSESYYLDGEYQPGEDEQSTDEDAFTDEDEVIELDGSVTEEELNDYKFTEEDYLNELYIRLETNNEAKYYHVSKEDNLRNISENEYLKEYLGNLSFDITCASLNRFTVGTLNYPSTHTLNFST